MQINLDITRDKADILAQAAKQQGKMLFELYGRMTVNPDESAVSRMMVRTEATKWEDIAEAILTSKHYVEE